MSGRQMPPSQLPPPSPLRTHVEYTPSESSSNVATPNGVSIVPPPKTGEFTHKSNLSTSSTSSASSSSYLSANGGVGGSTRPSSPGGNSLNSQAGVFTPSGRVVSVPGSGRVTPGIGAIAPGAVWGANGNGQNDVWGVTGGGSGGWGELNGENGMLPPPSPMAEQSTQQGVHPDNELDKLLRNSPLIQNLVQRIAHTEASVHSFAGQLANLNASLTSLLPARPTSSASSTHSNTIPTIHAPSGPPGLSHPSQDREPGMSPEAIRLLASQVMTLSTSVSQLQSLVALQQQTSKGSMMMTPQIEFSSGRGGGSGSITPHHNQEQAPFNLTLPVSKINTPTIGGGMGTPRTASPSAHLTSSPFFHNNNSGAPSSPRLPPPSPGGAPTGIPGGGSLSAATQWLNGPGARPGGALAGRPEMARSLSSPYNGSGAMAAAEKGTTSSLRRPAALNRMDSYETSNEGGWPAPPPGPMTPGGSNMGPGTAHNVTKWDQVGLVPELLRAVLKYGIGPPNKVQQRALPFLLRGADIIAQAPPTQERIIAYVVPGINACLSHPVGGPYKGPQVVIITTTVDQATQAYKLVRDLASPLGLRSSLCVGSSSANNTNGGWIDEQRLMAPSIVVGTPAKISELFTSSRALSGELVRFLVIDEVDQLIARNLYEFVIEVVKKLPSPRSRGPTSAAPGGGGGGTMSPSVQSPYDTGSSSPFNPSSNAQFPGVSRRFPGNNPAGAIGSAPPTTPSESSGGIDRQTCLFSNTVPQDVLNFSNAIQVREPVRVLVRRDGGGGGGGPGGGSNGNGSSAGNNSGSDGMTASAGGGTSNAGGGLKHLYLYLAFTTHSSARAGGVGETGAIGSGRAPGAGAEPNQGKEWKLDALADLLEDEAILPAIVFVGSEAAMDSVVYKLSSRGLEALFLHPEMNTSSRSAVLNKIRNPSSNANNRGKVLVIFDLTVKASDVGFVRLVVNYDLPRSVEGYAQRVSPAVSISQNRPGVIVNLIQANGGDVEMLRSIECAYKFKCSEVPVNLREAF